MTSSTWHVATDVWVAYAAGRLDQASENAVDTHVVGCATCRALAATFVEPAELEAVWSAVHAEVSRPPLPKVARALRLASVPDQDAVLIAGGSGMFLSWAVAVGGAMACAILTGFVHSRQDLSFLLLAPLIPVLAVAAVHDATDPLRDLVAGTPYSKFRLAMLRTAVAFAVAIPVTTAVGLVVPGVSGLAFAWLVPGLCLTVTTLLLLTWTTAWLSGGIVGLGWLCIVSGLSQQGALGVLGTVAGQSASAVGAGVVTGCLLLRTKTTRLHGGY